VRVLKEVRRVLQPDAPLLLAFHRGDEIRHFDELWEHPVKLDFIFFEREEMAGYLQAAAFMIDEVIERALRRRRSADESRLPLCPSRLN
jgi:hypothetical protein